MTKPRGFSASKHRRTLTSFRTTFGEMMEAWARLEAALFYWFMKLSGLEERLARAVYYSARSFNARRDIFSAVIRIAKTDAAAKQFIAAGLKKAGIRRWVSQRRNSRRSSQYVLAEGDWGDKGPAMDAITVEQMQIASRNFSALRDLFWTVAKRRDSLSSLEGYLEQIRTLLNEACSNETRSPSAKQRKRPPRA